MFLKPIKNKFFLTYYRTLKVTVKYGNQFQSLSTQLAKSKYYTIVCTYLKFSLNRTVAAQWNIILVESTMTSLSSSLRASLEWVSSLLIAAIFSLKSGFSSLNLSKSYQKGEMFISFPDIFPFSKTHYTSFPHQEGYFNNFCYTTLKVALPRENIL